MISPENNIEIEVTFSLSFYSINVSEREATPNYPVSYCISL